MVQSIKTKNGDVEEKKYVVVGGVAHQKKATLTTLTIKGSRLSGKEKNTYVL